MMGDNQYEEFWNFISLLKNNDLLKYVVVIGSWAEYLYAQSGVLPGFQSKLRTLDIDFLIKNMRRPATSKSISTIAKDEGYTIDNDVLTGTTKIYTPGLMEIEFIIGQKGKGEELTVSTNLGVNAQALRHMDILSSNCIIIEIFKCSITIPSPEAYVAHKIIINKDRGKKAEKDMQAILDIISYMDKAKFWNISDSLTMKEQKEIKMFIKTNNLFDL